MKDALDLTGIEGILSSKGTELLEQQVKILKLDLVFNPERTWTWEALAIAYKVNCFVLPHYHILYAFSLHDLGVNLDLWILILKWSLASNMEVVFLMSLSVHN